MHVNYTVVIQFYTASTQTNFEEDMDHDGQADGDSRGSQASGRGAAVSKRQVEATVREALLAAEAKLLAAEAAAKRQEEATAREALVATEAKLLAAEAAAKRQAEAPGKQEKQSGVDQKCTDSITHPQHPEGHSWRVRKDTEELESSQANIGDIGRRPAEGREKSEEGNLD